MNGRSVSQHGTPVTAWYSKIFPGVQRSCPESENNRSAYLVFVAAAALTGVTNAGHLVLAFSYIDENSSKKKSPFYIGNYRPQTKLREGNILTTVRLFTGRSVV